MHSSLAERLKIAMAGPPKVTGKSLAVACGVSPASVSDWLSGKSKTMDGHNLLAAADFLKVRAKWLVDGVGPMRGSSDHIDVLIVAEPTVAYLPAARHDKMTLEMLELFSQLDAASKRDYLNQLRGFVAGRRPHDIGNAPAVAEK